jgi:hypothetical protein
VLLRILFTIGVAAALAGCGGGSSSSSSDSGGGSSSGSSKLVAKVDHADAKVEGSSIVGTVKVTEGGHPGERLALRYGLVDAVSGTRASQDEQLAARYTTTGAVASKDVTIRFRKPNVPTDYLLHFVLYGPDGSYLASSDSPVFTVH